ncbi:hypothetical protein GOD62_29340 [Sinorhizobium medicae]|nr:hypothetical protein [Sinorhizobium medicae]MDX0796698.1 hypothetical protein [Sinorhizobium medicae]
MKRFLAALAILVFPTSIEASDQQLDTAVMRATHFARAPMPAADRRALAQAALAYWKSFDSRVPRNSPAVAEWLSKEMDTTDSGRIGRVASTPEYALMELAETSQECVALFQHLVNGTAGNHFTELYLWTKTLSCYKSPDSLLQYLQRAGLSNGRYDGEFSVQHFGFYHDAVTGYIANAIVTDPVQ